MEGMGLLNLKGQDSAWEPLTIARAGSETVWTQFGRDLEVAAQAASGGQGKASAGDKDKS